MNIILAYKENNSPVFFELSNQHAFQKDFDKAREVLGKVGIMTYQCGVNQDYYEPDGHGGGDYCSTIENSHINELSQLKQDHNVSADQTLILEKLSKESTYTYYRYVSVVSGSSPTLITSNNINPISESRLKALDSFVTDSLKAAGYNTTKVYNLENLSIDKFKTDPLLQHVNPVELAEFVNENSNQNQPITLGNLAQFKLVENSHNDKPELLENNANAQTISLIKNNDFYNAYGLEAEKLSQALGIKTFIDKTRNELAIGFPEKSLKKFEELGARKGFEYVILENINSTFAHNSISTSNDVLNYYAQIDPEIIKIAKDTGYVTVKQDGYVPNHISIDADPDELAEALACVTGHKIQVEHNNLSTNQQL